jgi:hypothetical protein
MKLGDLAFCWFAAALFLPLGGRQLGGVFGQHAGQTGEQVCQVFFGVDAMAAAVLDDGVEDGAFLPGFSGVSGVILFGAMRMSIRLER